VAVSPPGHDRRPAPIRHGALPQHTSSGNVNGGRVESIRRRVTTFATQLCISSSLAISRQLQSLIINFAAVASNSSSPHAPRPLYDTSLSLPELLPLLTPIEQSFFTALDVELNKVETFYLDREQEMRERGILLEEQLEELVEHRRLFYVCIATSKSYILTALINMCELPGCSPKVC
jgi:hypothetical protein